jgi:VWFA-related protein
MQHIWLTRLFRVPFAILALLAISVAQDAPTISVNVKVVNVLATVRDKHGNIINTLTKDDFVLDEDGRPQTIRYFTRETDLPLSLGLLVDTSLSQVKVLDQEKTASAAFTNELLREGQDTAFLIHFDREVELLQDLTSSRQKMSSALEQLQAPRYDDVRSGGGGTPGGGSGGGGRGRRGGGFGAGTLLYDSIFLASDEVLHKQPGRKAIVVLTDGVDHGSKMSLERAIESAQRADTMVYSIYFAGQEGGDYHTGMGSGPWGGGRRGGGWPGGGGGWPGGGGGYPGGGRTDPRSTRTSSEDGKKILERLSRETGGRMFAVSKKEPINEIYKRIEDELRNQYNLGYTPDHAFDSASDYRHIHVATKQKDLVVQAREGYYASRQVDAKQGN